MLRMWKERSSEARTYNSESVTRSFSRLHKNVALPSIPGVTVVHVETRSETSNPHYSTFQRSSGNRFILGRRASDPRRDLSAARNSCL